MPTAIGVYYLLSIQTKGLRPLNSHVWQFRLEGRVHTQRRCLPQVHTDLS